ncbi:metalloprotease [Bradyrhizobium sp. SHOUNA76]|uniref:metalloprotease n=1 Tax=Bradyrhizobium sp. SHOUNA76 TaxID=2908927 RepID=UPI001FF3B7E9|nr:hypothetical protein [Bradyrhizobium sp. SHOUNA76]MCJ9702026.1 hypothetical protein [Bradyrhizobium sp. SHOUNA76]
MLRLLALPIELLRIAFYVLQGLLDALRSRNRPRFASTVLIKAPREAVWRFNTANLIVLNGPPVIEISHGPLPDDHGLWLTRVAISGQPRARAVSREIIRDEDRGIFTSRAVEHTLSVPPEDGRDRETGLTVEAIPEGTALTMFNELTIRSFSDRIVYPIGLRRMADMIKQQCELEAGTHSQLAAIANHGLVLSVLALLSFCYLFGLKSALLLSIVIALHEAGHAVAMLTTGVGVHGIYLIPFFGGAAIPKRAYRSEGRLGFIALMGPGFSLIPTLGLFAMYQATGKIELLKATEMMAIVNAANLLPIYPLDGGLILNALVGSVNRTFAVIMGWIGVLVGLGLAIYFQSFLIGIPFLLFALHRYLSGHQTIALEPLPLKGGIVLAFASMATMILYAMVIRGIWVISHV